MITAPIDSLAVTVYTVPADAAEADGTLSWDSTTMVIVEVRSGEVCGTSFASALVTGAEVYLEHYKASFGNKWMWSPIALTPPLVAAGIGGDRRRVLQTLGQDSAAGDRRGLRGERAARGVFPRPRRGTTPQMIGRYPDYDVFDAGDTWDEATKRVVLARLEPPGPLRFFTADEEPALRAFCDTVLAQDREPRVPVAEMVDSKLARGRLVGGAWDELNVTRAWAVEGWEQR